MNFKFFIFFLCIIISCKSKSDNGEGIILVNHNKLEKKDNIFKIIIKIKVANDDVFEVYFLDDKHANKFEPTKKIRKKITGKNEFQHVVFEFPKGLRPYGFRIDLGENVHQKEMRIELINMKYNYNTISIKEDLIQYLFVVNEYLEIERGSGVVKIIERNSKRDPFITANPALNKKIKIEF